MGTRVLPLSSTLVPGQEVELLAKQLEFVFKQAGIYLYLEDGQDWCYYIALLTIGQIGIPLDKRGEL